MVDGPLPLLDRAQVEIVAIGDAPEPSVPRAMWTCPMCAQQRLVVHASFAVIRERNGAPMERQVLLCAICLGATGGDDRREGWPDPSRSARERADAQ